MNSIIIQTMKKLLTLSLTLVVLFTFAEISAAQSCIQPPSGLVAWWPLDELDPDTNEYVDLAGGDNNGTPFNNPTQILNEYVDNSLQMNTGRYVEVPAANATNLDFGAGSFTIDAWIKLSPGTNTEPIVQKRECGANYASKPGYFLSIIHNNIGQSRLQFQSNGATYLTDIINASPGDWIFVAAVIDRRRNPISNTVNLYVGVPSSPLLETQGVGGGFNASSPSSPLSIGRWCGNPHTGLGIDEVEIFNRPLSFTELDDIYRADTAGKCKNGAGGCVPPPNTTMVAWYPFDETIGSAAANLATGNTGIHMNSPIPVQGKVDRALNFNGTNNYVESPSTIVTNFGPANTDVFCQTGAQGSYSSCLGDFSIDAWIRLTPGGSLAAKVIVEKFVTSPARGYSFNLTGGPIKRLGLTLADGTGSLTTYTSEEIPSLTNNVWHHVAVTVDRRVGNSTTGVIRWYHNGEEISPTGSNNPGNHPGSLASSSPLRIGVRAFTFTGFFRGDIDELEIFNRVLLEDEVRNIFVADRLGKCK